jgi:hypothetical protein
VYIPLSIYEKYKPSVSSGGKSIFWELKGLTPRKVFSLIDLSIKLGNTVEGATVNKEMYQGLVGKLIYFVSHKTKHCFCCKFD